MPRPQWPDSHNSLSDNPGTVQSGGMSVSDAKRLKELETENVRLKKLLAESLLENEVTRQVLRK